MHPRVPPLSREGTQRGGLGTLGLSIRADGESVKPAICAALRSPRCSRFNRYYQIYAHGLQAARLRGSGDGGSLSGLYK